MVSLGFSPCPNDTFIFYALANKKIDTEGIDLNLFIEDIETLNHLAMTKEIDVTKISCHAFCYLQDDYRFLRTGGALGRGCGPLVVARRAYKPADLNNKKIAIPGSLTTASLLLNLFSSALSIRPSSLVAMPFYKIIQSVSSGKVDAGLIIHESRFIYSEYGLKQIIDLGQWWEQETGLPIPLGGIIAKKSLGQITTRRIENLIRVSIKYSLLHREEVIPFIKRYSQELAEDAINKHIALYINDYTLDIGNEGESALNELLRRARNEDQ
ncbi:1,4-dihydroxy-6-naphthoate synthase [Thermodesulfovibrionales bacterium]|nr:1,4-dihydroxy-6-naphthoate synthase [Thermodesulfovibrionales bacterium]